VSFSGYGGFLPEFSYVIFTEQWNFTTVERQRNGGNGALPGQWSLKQFVCVYIRPCEVHTMSQKTRHQTLVGIFLFLMTLDVCDYITDECTVQYRCVRLFISCIFMPLPLLVDARCVILCVRVIIIIIIY